MNSQQQQRMEKSDEHKKKLPEVEHVQKKVSVQVLVNESSKQAKSQQQQQHVSLTSAPLDALKAFNAVAALAAAQQQASPGIFSANSEQFPAMCNMPSTSKHIMQLMSSISPTSSSASYQRSYLEAFKFYKEAYGSAATTSGSSNPMN